MQISKEVIAPTIGLLLIIVSAQTSDYLPLNLRGINIGGIILGFVFLLSQSVLDLNIQYLKSMFKYLLKRLPLTIFYIIAEIWIGVTFIKPFGSATFEEILTQYLLFIVWIISGFYRIVIELTPVLFKLDISKAVGFYNAFSRTRFLYYTLLFLFFIRGSFILGYPINQIFSSLVFLIIILLPAFFFSFYAPVLPTQINWLITSWLNQRKLRLNMQILQYIYRNKSASFEELKINTKEDLKLRTALRFMICQRFLKYSNNKFEFHPWFILKQNIKFF